MKTLEAERDAARSLVAALEAGKADSEARVAAREADANAALATRDAALKASEALERALASEREHSRVAETRATERIRELTGEVSEHRRKAAEAARFVRSVERRVLELEGQAPARRRAQELDAALADAVRKLDAEMTLRKEHVDAYRALAEELARTEAKLAESAKETKLAEADAEAWRAACAERDERCELMRDRVADLEGEAREARLRALERAFADARRRGMESASSPAVRGMGTGGVYRAGVFYGAAPATPEPTRAARGAEEEEDSTVAAAPLASPGWLPSVLDSPAGGGGACGPEVMALSAERPEPRTGWA